MTIQDDVALLSKEAAVKLLVDMLKQAEDDKKELLTALRKARADLRDYGAVPIQQVRDNITAAIAATS